MRGKARKIFRDRLFSPALFQRAGNKIAPVRVTNDSDCFCLYKTGRGVRFPFCIEAGMLSAPLANLTNDARNVFCYGDTIGSRCFYYVGRSGLMVARTILEKVQSWFVFVFGIKYLQEIARILLTAWVATKRTTITAGLFQTYSRLYMVRRSQAAHLWRRQLGEPMSWPPTAFSWRTNTMFPI